MLIHLVLKDFLIVKKYVLLVLLVAVAVPPFLLWRNPELAAVLGQVFAAIFGVLMPLMYLGEKENKYTKATLLLAATPYPRKWMVVSKYLVSLLMFCACTLIFWLETLFFPNLGGFNAPVSAVLFFVVAIFLSLMNALTPSVFFAGMLLLSLALLAASACLSVRFYERADLA